MIEVEILEKEGISTGTIDDIEKKSNVWVDCFSPTKQELKELSDQTGISEEILTDCLDAQERPRTFEYDNFSQIIYRVPIQINKKISTTPVCAFVSKKTLITIRLNELEHIDKIKGRLQNKTMPISDLSYTFFRLLDEGINSFFERIDTLSLSIDKIEKEVVNHPDRKIMKDIINSKKNLIIFSKDLSGAREVLSAIEKEYVMNIDKKQIRHFRSIYNDVVQLLDIISTYRDILTGTMDIYLSSLSNSTNAVMKTLTVISAFVLIPTLISGIYGMNFANSPFNMPELSWKYGYYFALSLMGFSIIIMFIWFKKKKWI